MPSAKEAKKAIQTETKIMATIEKIMDSIVDRKMRMRIANWIYQKYIIDQVTTVEPIVAPHAPKPSYPYIPAPSKPTYPAVPDVVAYAAPFGTGTPTWSGTTATITSSQDNKKNE